MRSVAIATSFLACIMRRQGHLLGCRIDVGPGLITTFAPSVPVCCFRSPAPFDQLPIRSRFWLVVPTSTRYSDCPWRRFSPSHQIQNKPHRATTTSR